MGLFSRLNPFKRTQTKSRSRGVVALDAGSGVFYGLDDAHAGQLFIDDLGYSREILERAPAVGIVASVIGRFFKAIPLKLFTEDGDEHKGRGIHPVLRLFNERPNEFQSATSFREMLAQEMVYTGECVLRIHREGTTPHRIFCWPSNHVTLNQDTDWGSQLDQAIVYHYVSQSFALDPELPQVCHVRLNVDPQYPLRGRPAVYGMYPEVLANTFSSLYRKETFRQGGPPRMALVRIPDAAEADQGQVRQAATSFTNAVKTMASWMSTPVLPEGWEPKDLGPQGTDTMLNAAARMSDEKILAVNGIPVMFANNLERSTYSNSRTQDRMVVRDGVKPMMMELGSCIKRDLLEPMGGVHATLQPVFDYDAALEAEAAIFNKLIIDRVKAGIITPEKAAEELGYDASDVPDEPEPAPMPEPKPGDPADPPAPPEPPES